MPGSRAPDLAILFCLLATSLFAQQTLVVGPGQPFTTIAAGVAAAQPGDTVLVLAGTYSLPSTFTINKGIRLVGQGALIHRPASVFDSFQVRDLPANETFAMTGFGLFDQSTSSSTIGLRITNCTGPVFLQGLAQGGLQRWAIGASDCAQLHLADTALYSFSATNSVAIVVQSSTDTNFLQGMSLTGGETTLVSCTVRGGGVFPGPAIQMTGGTLVVTRSTLTGTRAQTTAYPAIVAVGGTVLLDPSAQLVPAGSMPPVQGTTPATFEFASLRAASTGDTLTVQAHGPADAFFATAFSLPHPRSVTPYGATWLDPQRASLLHVGTFDATTRRYSTTIPHVPLPAGLSVALQPVTVLPAGIVLGLPTVVTTP